MINFFGLWLSLSNTWRPAKMITPNGVARMGLVSLIGGGWDPDYSSAVYGPFLAGATAVAAGRGAERPLIATIVLDEGDGLEHFDRWRTAITTVAPCEATPVLVELGGRLDVAALGDSDGLLVCGGLTPGYADAIVPVAAEITHWLSAADRPYCGFSAGSAIAPATAVVGGWLDGTLPICSDDAAEDLDAVAVRPGLGLVPFAVDVHCAQWGTLPRLLTAVRSTPGLVGFGIDENTVLTVGATGAEVAGRGQVWLVTGRTEGVLITSYRAGQQVPFDWPSAASLAK
jgi:cyanophycinase